jgi:hypothetical protein
LLVAAIIAALLAAGVPSAVGAHVERAVCQIFGGDCPSDERTNARSTTPPTPGLIPTPPPTVTRPPQTVPPTPSPGPPVSTPPAPPVPPDQAETEAVLNETQLGRDALKWVHDHGVRVVYRKGGGSYYDGDDNVFYVDTDQSPEERANTFVHEVNHAEHRDDPDIDDLSRDDFIDKSIDEETEGTVEAIQNNQQLQHNRSNRQVPDTLLQTEYEDAYNRAIADENKARAKNQRPPLTPEEARRIGEDAGRRRVKEAFVNGEVVASTDGDTYTENYGEAWDDAHDCFLWIFC